LYTSGCRRVNVPGLRRLTPTPRRGPARGRPTGAPFHKATWPWRMRATAPSPEVEHGCCTESSFGTRVRHSAPCVSPALPPDRAVWRIRAPLLTTTGRHPARVYHPCTNFRPTHGTPVLHTAARTQSWHMGATPPTPEMAHVCDTRQDQSPSGYESAVVELLKLP